MMKKTTLGRLIYYEIIKRQGRSRRKLRREKNHTVPSRQRVADTWLKPKMVIGTLVED